jgi:peroxiredoxin
MKNLLFVFVLGLGFAARAQDADSVAYWKSTVEAHPDSLPLHASFIKAFEKSNHMTWLNSDSVLGLLTAQYNVWMQQFSGSAVVPFAIGEACVNAENPAAKPFLLKAASLNPGNAKVWVYLWEDAQRWGNFKGSIAYLEKAMKADPGNADYACYYMFSFEDDPSYADKTWEFVKKFPESQRSAQALYWLAYRSKDPKESLSIYKTMLQQFPPAKFAWTAGAMDGYYDMILVNDPAGAVRLSNDMVAALSDSDAIRDWTAKATSAGSVQTALSALAAGHATDAMAALATVKLTRWSNAREDLDLLKARALDASGNSAEAYDSLMVRFAKEPSAAVRSALVGYGAHLGKDAASVDAEAAARRASLAVSATPFKLYDYLKADSVALADYRGKVVLLTFWFPGCGPCRGEFPHFETALRKFKGQDIVYIGINVVPGQDPYVLPFMKSSGYSFTPLRDAYQLVQKNYKVRGEPTNFLIDREGRIVYSNFMIQNEKAQQMLELMIGTLLASK